VRSGGPQAGAPLQLTYLSYGIWSHRDSASTARRLTYALFGFPTTSANMPKTGSASYQTYVLAHQLVVGAGFGGDDDLTGTASFDVDFGTGGIKTDLNLGSAGLYNGTGLLSGDRFSGSFTSNIQYFTGGTFNGGFFGPTAQEMGYAFELRRHNPDPFAGAAPAPSDYLITGAVLGTKK
jgi:hypothetical protein